MLDSTGILCIAASHLGCGLAQGTRACFSEIPTARFFYSNSVRSVHGTSAHGGGAMGEWIRRISLWEEGSPPREVSASELSGARGLCWFEIVCGAEEADTVLAALGKHCSG